jgi:hypothetical protein
MRPPTRLLEPASAERMGLAGRRAREIAMAPECARWQRRAMGISAQTAPRDVVKQGRRGRSTRIPIKAKDPMFSGLSLIGETGFEPATARPPARVIEFLSGL